MPTSRCRSSGVIQMPAGIAPIFIFHSTDWSVSRIATTSSLSCSVTNAFWLSAEKAM